MGAKATNPKGVLNKVEECRFFLVRMADDENTENRQEFLYFLSAFMSAFRTVTYRLYGVTENILGKSAQRILHSQLQTNYEISFLLGRTNVELHEDGAIVFRTFSVRVADAFRMTDEPLSPGEWHDKTGLVYQNTGGWQFKENPKQIVELCHDGLAALEGFVRQTLSSALPGLSLNSLPQCSPV